MLTKIRALLTLVALPIAVMAQQQVNDSRVYIYWTNGQFTQTLPLSSSELEPLEHSGLEPVFQNLAQLESVITTQMTELESLTNCKVTLDVEVRRMKNDPSDTVYFHPWFHLQGYSAKDYRPFSLYRDLLPGQFRSVNSNELILSIPSATRHLSTLTQMSKSIRCADPVKKSIEPLVEKLPPTPEKQPAPPAITRPKKPQPKISTPPKFKPKSSYSPTEAKNTFVQNKVNFRLVWITMSSTSLNDASYVDQIFFSKSKLVSKEFALANRDGQQTTDIGSYFHYHSDKKGANIIALLSNEQLIILFINAIRALEYNDEIVKKISQLNKKAIARGYDGIKLVSTFQRLSQGLGFFGQDGGNTAPAVNLEIQLTKNGVLTQAMEVYPQKIKVFSATQPPFTASTLMKALNKFEMKIK